MKTIKMTDEEFLDLISIKKENYYKIAYSYVKSREDALDVLQEATYKAYLKKGSLRNKKYFNTWFVRILINVSISVLNKNKKYLPMIDEDKAIFDDKIDESKYDLLKALNYLELKYKNIIILKFYEDMTFNEISNVLKKPESTIKTNYYKAIELLKGKMRYEI